MGLSVIISTCNRKDILRKCLNALFGQTCLKSGYEIIVIDDGSTDGTENAVNEITRKSPVKLRYFKQENKGPAVARNVGIRNANGEIVLFIGDDIIAAPDLLEEHFLWHERYSDNNVAVLGYVTWSPEIKITPFMKWLENGGPQFSFWRIEDKVEVDTQRYFYTSNISLKRKFLLEKNGFFDEEFLYAAYEDNELGCRLKKKGLILKYNKNAIGYHHHFTSLNDACRRMIRVGESSQILAKKTGIDQKYYSRDVLREILSKFKLVIYYSFARFCAFGELHFDP